MKWRRFFCKAIRYQFFLDKCYQSLLMQSFGFDHRWRWFFSRILVGFFACFCDFFEVHWPSQAIISNGRNYFYSNAMFAMYHSSLITIIRNHGRHGHRPLKSTPNSNLKIYSWQRAAAAAPTPEAINVHKLVWNQNIQSNQPLPGPTQNIQCEWNLKPRLIAIICIYFFCIITQDNNSYLILLYYYTWYILHRSAKLVFSEAQKNWYWTENPKCAKLYQKQFAKKWRTNIWHRLKLSPWFEESFAQCRVKIPSIGDILEFVNLSIVNSNMWFWFYWSKAGNWNCQPSND